MLEAVYPDKLPATLLGTSFDGSKIAWSEFQPKVLHYLDAKKLSVLWHVAVALYSFMQGERDLAAAGIASNWLKSGYKATLNTKAYKIDKIREIVKGKGGEYASAIEQVKRNIAASHLGVAYKDLAKPENVGASSTAALEKTIQHAFCSGLKSVMRSIVRDFRLALRLNSDQKANSELDHFRPWLITDSVVRALMEDDTFDDAYLDPAGLLHENFVVLFLIEMMSQYDARKSAASGDVIEDVADAIKQSETGKHTFHELDQAFAQMLEPLAKACSTTSEMSLVLRASFCKKVIKIFSQKQGPEGTCWEKAHEELLEMAKEGSVDMQTIRHAVGKAEAHLKEKKIKPKTVKVNFASTGSEEGSTNPELAATLLAKLEHVENKLQALQKGQDRGKQKNKKPEGSPGGKGRKGQKRWCKYCQKEVFHSLENCLKFKEKILKEEVEKGKGAALAKCSDHSDDSNESESEYPMCATVTLTARKPTATKRANKATLSHCLSKEELGPCIDSGAQVTVTKKGRLVVRYKGKIIYLKPVSGSPTASSINVLNGGVHATEAAEDLLSLALLLKAGYRIELAVGTEHDPTFGGYLTTPCGKRIKLLFVDNLWRLPVWSALEDSLQRQQA